MAPLAPTRIRYIKLGAGGRWENVALEEGTLEWGDKADPHEEALRGDWEAVRKAYIEQGRLAGTATGYVNEARAVYDGDPDALWITFARGRMWWAFAGPEVRWTGGDGTKRGTRHRIARGGWSGRDLNGVPLDLHRLSTRLTKLAAYRRTICRLTSDQERLCLAYINAEPDADRAAVLAAQAALEAKLLVLIQRLSWADFEELVDLILARSGWTRVSALGGHQKDVDLVVEQPLTGERMAVQVKSEVSQKIVEDCAARLAFHADGGRAMLVYHGASATVRTPPNGLELMAGDAVARHAARAGLTAWILDRS
ncbi:MAG: restriction endonuclease [Sphingosinicella sp.]|uniref:restriction endonuclease n=1 Tax=Sphingosinicella sp. TaxID=1917971 RepID=UPI004037A5FD